MPTRFGQTFPDRVAVGTEVARRLPDLLRSLAALECTGEMGLRVFDRATRAGAKPSSTPKPPADAGGVESGRLSKGPGRIHLEGLAESARMEREATEWAREIAAKVGAGMAQFVLASDVQAPSRIGQGVTIAHLVARGSIEGYLRALEGVCARLSHLRIVREGPWPPYSFAESPGGGVG